MAKRRVTFNLEQGETEPQAAIEPPQQEAPPPAMPQAPAQPPARAYDRPRRETRRPAWQRSGDFDMEASALQLRCSDRVNDEADNSVGGVTGHVKDDSGSDHAKPAGQCEKPPPGGGTSIPRVAAMLGHFLEIIRELLTTVVKDNDVKAGQTDIMDSDVIKNDAD